MNPVHSKIPLNALRAFEATARKLSFAEAAEELGVTPGAVSQQVQKLEELTGSKLLIRSTRSVALTEAGSRTLPLIAEGLESLSQAMSELSSPRRRNVVTVSATPSFASCWLLPRLESFQVERPDTVVRVDARVEHAEFRADGVDVAIRHGSGGYPGKNCELLIEDQVVAVCSPSLLPEPGKTLEIEALRQQQLIHVDWGTEHNAAPTWNRWTKHHGVRGLALDAGLRFSMEEHALRAAIGGLGVALLTFAFVADELASGRLVKALPNAYGMQTSFHHHLVWPRKKSASPALEGFLSWVRNEGKRSTELIARLSSE